MAARSFARWNRRRSLPLDPDAPSPEVLPAALDQFQQAVLARADSETASRVTAYSEATASLEAARGTYFEALTPTLDAETLLDLDGQVVTHSALGTRLVKSADARRRLLNEFGIESEALDKRMKASLDKVWAIFGKTVGREYLVDANRILDELGGHNAEFSALQGYDSKTVRVVRASERAFRRCSRTTRRA